MRIYLVRHAKAERQSPTGRDEDRSLTNRGKRQAGWLAGAIQAREREGVRLAASPAARAQETAAILAEALRCPIDLAEALGLDSSPRGVVGFVAGLAGDIPWVLVGHNPTFSRTADVLVSGATAPLQFELRTGEAAVLEIADPAVPIGSAKLLDVLRIPEADDRR
ncbi:MAG: histidine phosphatase family protein [Phycisphaerales bacterium]|nr:histidine phosphatase family protein [Phycisphaerales bacterium]